MAATAAPTPPIAARKRRVPPDRWLKPGLFLGALVPLGSVLYRLERGGLGANPIATMENELGLTALIFLVASLVCTPLRRLLGWTWPMRIRRELGLFAFFYAVLHFLIYVLVDQGLDLPAIVADVVERPFISVGFLALLLLVPIAVTSTNDWVKRLGYQRWLHIHQLVYVVLVLAVLHFIWRVKIDLSQPLAYAAVGAFLLGIRVVFWARSRLKRRSALGK